MKQIIAMAILISLLTVPAFGAVKTLGSGKTLEFDPSGIPPKMKEAYALMKVKCIKCHTMERTVVAVNTGIAPVSNTIFDKGSTKAYGIKMLRKPDSNMTKQDVKTVIDLLNYLLDQASK